VISKLWGLILFAAVANVAPAGYPTAVFAQDVPVSESAATWASALGTLVPVTVGVIMAATSPDGYNRKRDTGVVLELGLLIGPSVGHFYAREPKRVFLGLGLRGAALAAYVLGPDCKSKTAADALGTLGGGLLLASAMTDIAAAKKSARRHNERIAANGMEYTPIFRMAGRSTSVGLRVNF